MTRQVRIDATGAGCVPAMTLIQVAAGQDMDIVVDVPLSYPIYEGSVLVEFGISKGPCQPYLLMLPTTHTLNQVVATLPSTITETLPGRTYFSCWVGGVSIARGQISTAKDSWRMK